MRWSNNWVLVVVHTLKTSSIYLVKKKRLGCDGWEFFKHVKNRQTYSTEKLLPMVVSLDLLINHIVNREEMVL